MDQAEITRRQEIMLRFLGVPYGWGGGSLKTAVLDVEFDGVPTAQSQGVPVLDCSGEDQHVSIAIGDLRPGAWSDLSANDIANACDPVEEKDLVPGDKVFFKKPDQKIHHVGTVFAKARGARPTMMIEAGGGGSNTHGHDLDACVEIRAAKRAGFLCFGRLKKQYRASGSKLP